MSMLFKQLPMMMPAATRQLAAVSSSPKQIGSRWLMKWHSSSFLEHASTFPVNWLQTSMRHSSLSSLFTFAASRFVSTRLVFDTVTNNNEDAMTVSSHRGEAEHLLSDSAIWQSSTMKKRRMKMNKHKLKKRRKDLKMNTKASRG